VYRDLISKGDIEGERLREKMLDQRGRVRSELTGDAVRRIEWVFIGYAALRRAVEIV
jgi:hypothetical protein